MTLDRTLQPPFVLPAELLLPPTRRVELPGGLRFWSVDTGTEPVVRLSLVFEAGTRWQSAPFVASATLNLMSEGTARYSAAQIAERFDFYGIYYDTSIDRDYTILTLNCLSRFLDEALDLLEEILLRPAFDPGELRTYASKKKQQLILEREKPSYQARELFSQALFGREHPYGVAAPTDGYDNLRVELLRAQYERFYHAGNCFAVASGQIPAAVQGRLEAFLSKLPRGHSSGSAICQIPEIHSETLVRQRREGALQSSLRIGKALFPKGHPDWNGMQVLSMVLGGYFGSRLVANLREDKGYTYGIYSAMMALQQAGYLAIASDVTAPATDDAVREIFTEIERLRTQSIPAEELEMVRNMIVGELMRILDGPFGVADVVIEQVQSGVGDESVNAFLQEVRSITPRRLQELAIQYLDPASFTTVIVGA